MAIHWETCPICYGGDVNCPENCESTELLGPQRPATRCISCGRLPTEDHCDICHRAVRAIARLADDDTECPEDMNTEAVNQ